MPNNVLIITGCAPCLESDIESLAMPEGTLLDWMAIGLDAVDRYTWPIKYMATYHPPDIEPAKERRRAKGGNVDYQVISHIQFEGLVDIVLPLVGPSGSSAMLGVLTALKMGYTKIILCGCPMAGTNNVGNKYEDFRPGWTDPQNKRAITGKVKSMSGWTAELLGKPTEVWINE